MDWLLNILRSLFGIEKTQTKEPVQKAGRPLEKPKSSPAQSSIKKPVSSPARHPVKVDGRKIFESMTPMVKPLLKEMARNELGKEPSFQAQPEALRWSTWYTDTNSYVTEYWSVTLIPELASLKIKCTKDKWIESGLSESEFKQALAKAAKIGPAIRNIPIENILDDQI